MVVSGLAAWALHHWMNFPFWVSFGIVILALLINGWVAAGEDHW
jgi:hypothetical protein